ncbi:MAG: 50S ribosomal protein L4 [Candidatus Woesebacteria bacterium]|jgi:large subunit ribosomal protein L4
MAESTKKTESTLNKSVFAVDVPNHELLKLAYEAYLANGRPNLAKTLCRGEVSGGGKKPWKQKGTGRARFGSSRNPIWRKGGVVFGPLGIENYKKKISSQNKRVALRQALTLAAQANEIVIVDDIKTTGKTKEIAAFLNKQEANNHKHVVIVVENKTPELVRATSNLQGVILSQATYLNVFNILNADKLIVTKAALKQIEEWLGGDK